MSNLETYREKGLKCARAADEAHGSSERVGLLGLAIVYMALADCDGRHEHARRNAPEQDQDMRFEKERS
jgi:hypothetical protein